LDEKCKATTIAFGAIGRGLPLVPRHRIWERTRATFSEPKEDAPWKIGPGRRKP